MDAQPDEFILCADDYAQTADIDAGILQLLRQQRLTAVSCLVESPRWPLAAGLLQEFSGQADIGLHLNFTQAFAEAKASADVKVWPLPALIARAYLQALPATVIEQRIAAQIDAFAQQVGRLPDFLDGHRHVHQLPQIREALLRQIARYWQGRPPPWVRITVPRHFRGGKAALIAALGGRALARQLAAAGIPGNRDFAGVYALQPGMFYRSLMQIWLHDLAPGGLLMTHPGVAGGSGQGDGDVIAAVRPQELDYLGSAAFLQDCAGAGKKPARFTAGRPGM